MWFTIGVCIACGLSAWVLWTYALWMVALGAALLGGIAAFAGRRWKLGWPGVLLLGCAAGFLWFGFFQTRTLTPLLETDGQVLEARLRVSDFPDETEYGTAVEALLAHEGKQYRVRVYLDDAVQLHPGDRLSGPFRFRITTPGGQKDATWHQGRGIYLLLYQEGEVSLTPHGERTWRERIRVFRRDLTDILENTFPADTMPFAKALLMGDTSDLSYKVDSDLKLSGIRHVAAVSGLHVSILVALVSVMTLKRRFLTAAVGLPALLLFAALVGFAPSVTRSCLMCALMLLAQVADNSYDGLTSLSFAVLVMLLGNPLVITDIGFQLSVGSVAGICLLSERLGKWVRSLLGDLPKGGRRKRLAEAAASSLAVSLSAMAVTVPLSAFYFGTVSLISVLTNLLTLWAISLIFYGILAVAMLALTWQAGAVWLAQLVSLPIRYVLWMAGVMAEFPLAAVYTCNTYVVLWLVFAYLLVGIYLVSKKGRPRELCCCLVLSFCLSMIPARIGPWMDRVRFSVLDVGQGQCLIFQSRGKTVMVDCGGSGDEEAADRAAGILGSQSIGTLDALILTHWDDDHSGGAGELLTRVDTELLILPDMVPEEILSAGQTLYARQALDLAWEGTRIRIFPAQYGGNSNEKSLCVLFDTENCDILITGDRSALGERSLLRSADLGRVDVLVAGHHGAKDASSRELLEAVRPQVVCISAGENNPYGHPSPETLKRLEEFGCQVYRTDLQGDIIIRR